MTKAQFDLEQAWASKVPSHWRWTRNKELLVESQAVTVDGSEELLSVSHLTGVTPKSQKNVTMTAAENLDGYRLVKSGDLVINTMWAWMGALGVARQPGIVSPAYGVYSARTEAPFNPAFYDYLYRSTPYVMEMTRNSRGIWSSRLRLYPDVFLRMAIPVPPPDEQRAIADYLARETDRIDTLIKEQQRLIKMLRERRQAVIDASFSPLGEPNVQLRRYIKFLTSGSRGWGDYYADQGKRFLRIGNLPRANLEIGGDIQLVDLPANVTEGSRTMLQEGDLLLSITAYLGSVAVVEGDWVGAYVSQHVALCRLERDRVDPRFIGWFMLTTTGQDELNEGAAGGAKMQLALDDIKGLRVPTAPIQQQRRIAAHLDRQTAKIDELVTESERFIELARERRTALMTAAVTGQIDVRESV
ncbi:restriction endonuclease subunit S [Actinokineospora sp. UTMC 2448]|uniref:restriction endonuclease subunit S n=1 Tax=Actinokineospora sp. UTMC 2448 TaxID=2268449 RepID=UPI00216463B1|nr:restriction endonuclease subunit S [Actinokineospora sp. UTMC 2448]UVS80183.1 EcoKI restriction-modification system protein HsdS [Actinokineospora sp. UTMC 2448]